MSQRDRKHRREHYKRLEKNSKTKQMMKDIGLSILKNVLLIVHLIADWFLELFLGWYLGERRRAPAISKDFFIARSSTEVAEMIRKREVTAYQVVKAYIDRIVEVNPMLNAVIDGPFMDSLDEAQALDERIENGEVTTKEFEEKPFFGVPFTTKDSTSCKGRRYTFGLISRRDVRAKEDAECIRLMKEAGGILVATTSIPEVNLWQETRNNLIGNTNNPYDTRRTTGGSSGGEAALISSCASAFGIGTDIGGSIRMPAYYCGIFGHKGTVKVVDTRGVTDRTGKEEHTMVVAGPMTRSAKDLLPLFKVLAGPKNSANLKLDSPVDVKKLRYFYVLDSGDLRCTPLSPDTKGAIDKAVRHFAELTGRPVEQVRLPGTEYTSKMWRYWMTQEPAVFNIKLGNGKRLSPYVEVPRKLLGQSPFTWGALYSLVNELLPQEKAEWIKEITARCEEELRNLLGDDGVLLYPSYPRTAPFHYAPLVQIYNFGYWSLFNVLHCPATQVPMGLNGDGVPMGIQVVACKNRDVLTLRVAEELERAFGGWVPAFTVKKE